jgi:hypothetical protein
MDKEKEKDALLLQVSNKVKSINKMMKYIEELDSKVEQMQREIDDIKIKQKLI